MYKKVTFLGIFLGILGILLFSTGMNNVSAASKEAKAKLSIRLTNSGNPQKNISLNAANYDAAYHYIMTGIFPDTVLTSPAWQSAQDSMNTIAVAGFIVGQGNKHSDGEVKTIISTLFNTNFTLLQSINETNNGSGTLGFNPPSNFFKFHVPGGVDNMTNKRGEAEVEVPNGMTAVVDSNRNLLKLLKVTSGMKEIKIDTDSSGLSLTFANQKKVSSEPRTVEFNQEIHYTLKVSKSLLNPVSPTSIILRPDANIVIDETSVPNTISSLMPRVLNPESPFDSKAGPEQLSKVARKIGDRLISWQINMYELIIPPTDSSVSIDIKAHLAPVVTLNNILIGLTVWLNTINMDIPINASDAPDNDFGMTANALLPQTDTQISAAAPKVNTTGINFVQVDADKNTLVRDAVYVLGKSSKGKKYLYDTQGQWVEITDVSALVPTDYTLLRGGNQYVFGDTSPIPIPLSGTRFNYNFDRDSKINQSLIKLFGLGEGKNYFLYQVATPTSYPMDKTPIAFSVFSEKITSPNDSHLVKTSIKFAANQSFKLNGLIPDYSAGSNEYNLLAVTSQKKVAFNSAKSILLPLVLVILGIIMIGGILVKVV